MSDHASQPFSESNLDSPEYRARLLQKLRYLINVLELAIVKVHRNLKGPAADTDRLLRIRKNLQDTLEVCTKARAALERREKLSQAFPHQLEQVVEAASGIQSRRASAKQAGARIEMSSDAEHERFQKLGQIQAAEIAACDLDELTQQF
jgi:hypothetical protein